MSERQIPRDTLHGKSVKRPPPIFDWLLNCYYLPAVFILEVNFDLELYEHYFDIFLPIISNDEEHWVEYTTLYSIV